MKKNLKLPKFRNEDAERAFWSRVKLHDYFEPSDFERVSFPNLKPSSQPISIRLPSPLLFRIKERANELGVPYQAFIKNALSEKLKAKH
ncbi:MAG TPA: BrnA antitoxin family protein [Candidatus Paceibacterota bacterium]